MARPFRPGDPLRADDLNRMRDDQDANRQVAPPGGAIRRGRGGTWIGPADNTFTVITVRLAAGIAAATGTSPPHTVASAEATVLVDAVNSAGTVVTMTAGGTVRVFNKMNAPAIAGKKYFAVRQGRIWAIISGDCP